MSVFTQDRQSQRATLSQKKITPNIEEDSDRNGHPPDPSDEKAFPELGNGSGNPLQSRSGKNAVIFNGDRPVAPPPLPPRNKRSPLPDENMGTVVNRSKTKGRTRNHLDMVAVTPPSALKPPQLVFHCSLAHGSPTGLLSGFNSVKELYAKAAEIFEIPVDEVLFCTLNTFKLDMTKLLGGQLGLDDFIYIHVKGQKKEVEIVKSESALGLTITDNGAGKAFIKRIKPGSLVERLSPAVKVGDHFQKLNDEVLVGKRHFHVAKGLRDIPVGKTFTLRLIEPLEAGFNHIGPRSSRGSGRKQTTDAYGSGKQTVRFKANKEAVVEDAPDTIILDRMEFVLENYLGVSDRDLALTVWDLGKHLANPIEFTETLATSELAEFQIPENVVFDLWGVISDWRKGTLKPVQQNLGLLKTDTNGR